MIGTPRRRLRGMDGSTGKIGLQFISYESMVLCPTGRVTAGGEAGGQRVALTFRAARKGMRACTRGAAVEGVVACQT